jgi:signal transduction histidine kinase/CheY-like chemotaxis protein
MERSNTRLDFEPRLPPRALIPPLLALALLITVRYDTLRPRLPWWQWGQFVLLLYLVSLAIWTLHRWKLSICRWFTAIALVVLAHLGIWWMEIPHFSALIGIPVALTVPLVGLPAAVGWGIVETALLVWVPGLTGAGRGALALALASLWGTLGVALAITYPRRRLDTWLYDYFSQAQRVLEGERDQRAELKQALDDLAHANRQLVLANERLADLRLVAEEAQKAKSTFVAKVSHEFRTPLNMILGLVGIMVETPELYGQALPDPVLEDLQIIHRNCRHLSSMINDVLALSQAEAGRLALHREWVALPEIIDNACDVVRPLLDKKCLDLHISVPDDLPQIYCDRTRIRQVILNLVSNAARFTERGGISIQVQGRSRDVVVSVRDTGPGIAPQDAERIFEPFCQGSGGLWRDKRGTGLGLSISKEFVELHGGRIWLESELGAGTTFTFELPVSQPLDLAVKPTRWIKEDWEWLERRSRARFPDSHYKPRVIICDENGDLYAACERFSDEAEWIDTRDLAQVARELEQSPAHAVVINTPSPNDLWPVVSRARQSARGTPVVGCSMPPRLKHVLEAHAIDYLVKPVTRDSLQGAMARVNGPVRRVLIVDDDPDVLQLWTRMLRIEDEALDIVTAANGQDALRQLRAASPDLVLLDIVLPDVDGWQVLEAKEQEQAIRDIPVILVSAQDPTDRPLSSEGLLLTMGDGLPLAKVLEGTIAMSALMLKPG